jgi:hypothetical protein
MKKIVTLCVIETRDEFCSTGDIFSPDLDTFIQHENSRRKLDFTELKKTQETLACLYILIS